MINIQVFFDSVDTNSRKENLGKFKIQIPESPISIRELIHLSTKHTGSSYIDEVIKEQYFSTVRDENYRELLQYWFKEGGEQLERKICQSFEKDNLWIYVNHCRITGKTNRLITLSEGQEIHFLLFDSLSAKLEIYRIDYGPDDYVLHYPELFSSIFCYKDIEDLIKGKEYIEKELHIDFVSKFGVNRWNFVNLYEKLLTLSEAKFIKQSKQLIEVMGEDQYFQASKDILVDHPPYLNYHYGKNLRSMHKSLLLTLSQIDREDVFMLIEIVFKHSDMKIPGKGQASKMLSNACLEVLESINTKKALQTCFKLKRIAIYTNLNFSISRLIKKLGLTDYEVEELKAPSYEFDEQLQRKFHVDNHLITLTLALKNKIQKRIVDEAGNEIRDLPKKGLEAFKEEIAEIKYLEKNIPGELRFHRNRIENSYRTGQSWLFSEWHNLYIQNPIVAYSARRLIWHFSSPTGQSASGIWKDGGLVDSSSQQIPPLEDNWTVKLWHPVEEDPSEVSKWKEYIFNHQITQPFKQAFREIYTVTPPELVTRTFSNRFAAHILYKHQFAALASSRGWNVPDYFSESFNPENKLLGYDVEFCLGSSFGGEPSIKTNEIVFRNNEYKIIEIQSVPPIVFSEAMRDIDMFVSVSSIGVDPAWTPDRPDYNYWSSYGTGELTNSAVSRKELLERIVPGLLIADKCSIEDRWLRVTGNMASYRIHIGSGSVYKDTENKHICIVPKAATTTPVEKIYLPFEEDWTLSLILSKAFLLANDNKIKDPSILSQIRG